MEAGAKLEEGGDPPADGHPSGRWRENARDELEERALSRAVGPDDAQCGSSLDVEGKVTQRPEGFVRVRAPEPAHEQVLKRAGALVVDCEPLRDVVEADCGLDHVLAF